MADCDWNLRAFSNIASARIQSAVNKPAQAAPQAAPVARGTSPRVDRRLLNFSVAIGSRVPQSLHVVTLPDEIVRIVPQYRGFDYFLISYRTKDPGGADYFFVKDELLIIDPQTLEIVAIIPV